MNDKPVRAQYTGVQVGSRTAGQELTRQAVLDWGAVYNHRRLQSSLDYLSPMHYEQR